MTSVNSTPKANTAFYLWTSNESTLVYQKSMLEVDDEGWIKALLGHHYMKQSSEFLVSRSERLFVTK